MKTSVKILAACIALAGLMLPMTATAQVTVTNTSNTGAGSLRQAINDVSDGGMITISTSLAGQTIMLASTLYITTKSVIIEGNGIILSGDNACKIMLIDATGITVTIRRVHFRDGKDTDLGGAICIDNGTLNLQSCIFSGNSTTESNAWGGALYNSGILNVQGCTFYNNSTYRGGAIYNKGGTSTLAGNLFYGNTASGGAVIYLAGGTVTSGGYNVYDGTSANFTFNGTGDKQITALAFHSDIRPTDAVADIVAAGLANFPAEFFDGGTRTFPNGTAGAMKSSDVTAPTVASVTPSGTGVATSGNVVITFSEAMDAGTAGTVQLNSLSALTGGTWSAGNTVFTVACGGLVIGTAYTVNISGFKDVSGNTMAADNTHSFTTFTPTIVTNINNAGAGSLRQAITNVSDGGTITFDASLAGLTITLASTLPTIAKSVTIEGNGITLSGGGAYKIMLINATGKTVTIRRVHFKDGKYTDYGGAIRIYDGTLNLQSCIFSGNSTTAGLAYGGALYNRGNLNVQGCTFYNNSTPHRGGAIYNDGGTSTLAGNLFYGNTASYGAVIYRAGGTLTSGGYNVYDGTSYDFTFNGTGDTQSTALAFDSDIRPTVTAANIVAAGLTNFPAEFFDGETRTLPNGTAGAMKYVPDVTAPTVASVTPSGTGAATSGNIVITFDEAMDAGAAGTVQLNSLSALTGGAWSDGNTVFTIAYSGLVLGTAYTVNISGFKDEAGNTMAADNTHSFTTVAPTVTNTNNAGAGSLRQAMIDLSDGGTITFDASLAGLTITLASTLPTIAKSVTIEGNGITLSGGGACKIMLIGASGITVTIRRVHFKDGKATDFGGAIYNNSGTLNLQSCIFSGNRTTNSGAWGGALYNSGNLNVQGCTFYNNSTYQGGAIYNGNGTSTLAGNLFYGNTASGGAVIYRDYGTVTSGGYNVYDGASSGFTFNGTGDTQITALAFDSDIRPKYAAADIVAAGLANFPAEFFNGETRTFPNGTAGAMKYVPDITAPTVASVTPSGTGAATSGNVVITFDEPMDAGTTGTVQLNSLSALTGGAWSDGNTVFTVAYSGLVHSTAHTVNISGFKDVAGNTMAADNTHSFTTGAPTIVTNTNNAGAGSLRQAITDVSDGGTITFDASLAGRTITLASTLTITKSVTIEGNGITLSGNSACKIMDINATGKTVTIRRVHFKDGKDTDYGGAIRNYSGTLNLQSCIFSGNSTTAGNAWGGTLYNGGNLNVQGCTFYNNSTSYRGGAIYNGGVGTSTLAGNLFYGNTASDAGAVIYRAGGTLTSGGYNVYDGTSYNFTFNGTGDTQSTALAFDSDIHPTVTAVNIVAAGLANFPAEFFDGETRTFPNGTAGAMKYVPDITAPTVASVTPSGTGAAVSGNIVITFNEPMDAGTTGTVQLNSLSALTGGAWSDGNTVFTVAYGGLAYSTAYTVNISGFKDAAGNTMTADNTHSFTTVTPTIVTITNDTGAGSLRWAITNVSAGGTIAFDASLAEQTITLASTLYITKSVTIEGNGITLSGDSACKIMAIDVPGITVTIRRVHFRDGKATDNGGAIRNYIGNTLNLQSCIFSGNSTTASDAYGGTLSNVGILNVQGCTFYNNSTSFRGGAIFNSAGTSTLAGNLFYGNTASEGAVIYRFGGTVTSGGYNVYDGTSYDFTFNGTGDTQITVLAFDSDIRPTDAAVNIVAAGLANLPAEFFDGETRTFPNGTAGAMKYVPDITAPTVAGVTPFGTDAAMSGNVVITFDEPMDAGTTGTVQLNSLSALTGGAWSDGNTVFTVAYSGLVHSTAHTVNISGFKDVAGNTMAADNTHSFTTVTPTIVTNTNNAGAGSLRQAITDLSDGGTITFDASLAGQTITLASTLYITKSVTIEGNGITLSGDSACKIMDINATGITVTIRRVHFRDGKATDYGGAIRIDNGTLNLQSCIFSGNSTTVGNAWGGALCNRGILNAQGCTFYNNSTSYQGGAIYNSVGTSTLTGNLFYGNTASDLGAVIYLGSGTVTSGGYNVYDGASIDFTFNGTGDTQITVLAFDSDIRPTDAVADIVAAGLANFPAEFFDGETRTFPNGTAGAMKSPDVTAPTVAGVTPSGTDAATSGNVVITFSEAMDEGAAGTVQLNSLSALTGGAWSDGNTVFTVAYSGLTNSTAYTVNISGFEDAAGNTMTADNTHSFTTGASAQTPAITAHPQPATYAAGATATALTVTASVSDGGTLSYQWYRNTTDSNTDGTPITGATDVAYTPPTATAGTTYYYVVVTNTNNSVSGTQTATAASNTAAVTVNTSGTSTGVGETLKADISAYPNPFRGTLHLVGAEGCTLTVFTSTGALVHTQKLTAADETIHLEHLPTGLYLFRLEKDGKTKTIKIVNRE